MAKSNTKSGSSSYKFYNMGSNGLKHDVMCGTGVAIPAGTKNVKIAFRQSHLRRWDEEKQRYVPMNVYCWNKPGRGMTLVHS